MPNSATFFGVRRERDEVLGDRGLVAQRRASSQSRAVRAFVSVSCVVKVFEATMNSVSRRVEVARRPRRCRSPSTFETKWNVRSRSLYGFSAS